VPQPPLPAPLAPRPEPGALLLEAVRQRHSQSCLQLAQQWVHRRGVGDLQRFCSTELVGSLGVEASTWLQNLLALEGPGDTLPATASTATCAAEAGSINLADAAAAGNASLVMTDAAPEGETTAAVLTAASIGEVPPVDASELLSSPLTASESSFLQESPAQEQELQTRAVAAVDEAFAALAESFEKPEQISAPAPLPITDASSSAASGVPEPLPVRGGLWPSLRTTAASLSSAFSPAGADGGSSHAADAQSDPIPTPRGEQAPILETHLCEAEAVAVAEAAPGLTMQDDPTIPELHPTLPSSGEDGAAADPATTKPGETSSTPAAAAGENATETTSQDGLLQRLRGRIETGRLPRLSRLRAVMRDCVEETVALLRTPEAEHHEENGGFATNQSLEAAPPTQAAPDFSWTLDPLPSPATGPATSSSPSVPAATGQAITADAASGAPSPSRRAPSSRLRFGLPPAKPAVGDRPAPAPAALSDLRAWLPDSGDLPRAS
jgi:hypothetical protein